MVSEKGKPRLPMVSEKGKPQVPTVSEKGKPRLPTVSDKQKPQYLKKGKFRCPKKGKLGVRQFLNKKKPLASDGV